MDSFFYRYMGFSICSEGWGVQYQGDEKEFDHLPRITALLRHFIIFPALVRHSSFPLTLNQTRAPRLLPRLQRSPSDVAFRMGGVEAMGWSSRRHFDDEDNRVEQGGTRRGVTLWWHERWGWTRPVRLGLVAWPCNSAHNGKCSPVAEKLPWLQILYPKSNFSFDFVYKLMDEMNTRVYS